MWQKFNEWRRAARAREVAAYDGYRRLINYPLFVLSLMFLIAFAITLTPGADATELRFAHIVIPLTWVVFAIDYALGILMAPKRWVFARTHVVQAVALLFPPLRILMLFHVFSVLRKTPIRRGDLARMYVLYATTLLLVFCAVLVVYFERQAPNANITSFGDALWWGGETVSTVGYGDFYPVTVPGRLVAAILFVNGVALVSVITAGLAQNFTADDNSKKQQANAQAAVAQAASTQAGASTPAAASGSDTAHVIVPTADMDELHRRLTVMEQTMETMAAHLTSALAAMVTLAPSPDPETTGGKDSDPDRRVGTSEPPAAAPAPPTMGDTA